MSLIEISLPEDEIASIEIPSAVERLIVETEKRIDAFMDEPRDAEIFAFVPCDFRMAYRGLSWLKSAGLAPGRLFCEWGSGFGGTAMLATLVGFRSCGIEVLPDLVDASISLAKDFDVEVDFVCGSFIPEESHRHLSSPEEFAWLDLSAEAAYEELGYDADSFDLIFAYPWPNEQHLIYDLFEACASDGALLLTYHGEDGLCLNRCVRRGDRRF
ncbi:MAG: hypothetical protein P1V97_03610 [Planctomycetota bacterium]|nr:hypothetical protein [Planctomycetota bacterium]